MINIHRSDDLSTLLNIETNDSFEKPNEFSHDSVVTLPSDDIVNKYNLFFKDNSEYEVHNDFKDIVIKNILSFIRNLYSKLNVTGTLLQEIIEEVRELFSNEILFLLKNKVINLLPMYNVSEINEFKDMFNILKDPFVEFKSEYLRMK